MNNKNAAGGRIRKSSEELLDNFPQILHYFILNEKVVAPYGNFPFFHVTLDN